MAFKLNPAAVEEGLKGIDSAISSMDSILSQIDSEMDFGWSSQNQVRIFKPAVEKVHEMIKPMHDNVDKVHGEMRKYVEQVQEADTAGNFKYGDTHTQGGRDNYTDIVK